MGPQARDALRLTKKTALFLLPFALVSASYFIADPFQVLRPRRDYYKETWEVEPPRDFVSTQLFMDTRAERGYDSFVFGSSRSRPFQCLEWSKYLPDDEACFHFDSSSENLHGLRAKVLLIDRLGSPIRHALVVVDHELLSDPKDPDGAVFARHPLLCGSSDLAFQLRFFTAYWQKLFFLKFLDHRLSGGWRPYMDGALYPDPMRFDPLTNDQLWSQAELDWQNSDAFYERMAPRFDRLEKSGAGRARPPVINARRRRMLEDIRDVFQKHRTRYLVVLGPLFDRVPLHAEDKAVLEEVFGKNRVIDYSGENELSRNRRNHFDPNHFKLRVGNEILRRIYNK